ncbi:MAG TPA: polyhydroxyalkanoic acid system family protein [Polyangiaceae bacterium]
MKHAVVHDLGQDLAKKVAVAAFASYAQKFGKYSPTANWVTDKRANISFSVKGMTLSGSLEVSATAIEMDLDVPFLLKPFKGTAISVIEGEIRAWIEKAKAGEIS